MLPETRNTTYAPGIDVRSADLNDLQDAVIGGKHGRRRIVLKPGQMMPFSGTTYDGTHAWVGTVGGSFVNADLPLTEADRLRQFTLYGRVVTAGEPILVQLIDRDLVSGDDDVGLPLSSATTVGAVTFGSEPLVRVVGPQRLLFLQVRLAGEARLLGIDVLYDRPQGGVSAVRISPDSGGFEV